MQKYQRQSEKAKRVEAVDDAHAAPMYEEKLDALEAADDGENLYDRRDELIALAAACKDDIEASRRVLTLMCTSDVVGAYIAADSEQALHTMQIALRSPNISEKVFTECATRYAWEMQWKFSGGNVHALAQEPFVQSLKDGFSTLVRGDHPEEVRWVLDTIYRADEEREIAFTYEYQDSLTPVLCTHLFASLDDDAKKRLVATLVDMYGFEGRIASYKYLFTDKEFAQLATLANLYELQKHLTTREDAYDEDVPRDFQWAHERFDAILQGDVAAFSRSQLVVLLGGAYQLDRALSVADLEKTGISHEEVIAAIEEKFSDYRHANIGHAVQFAWRYPELNIQNIPHALNAAELQIGKWIPDEIFGYVAGAVRSNEKVDAAVVASRKTHALVADEFVWMQQHRPEALELIKGKPNAEMIMRELADTDRYESDENIRNGMQTMRDVFGADVTLQYANRMGLSRHDAFYFAPDIAAFVRTSGLLTKDVGRMLLEVAKDDASYFGSMSAHAYLAVMMQVFARTPVESVLAEARQFSNLEELQTLVREVGDNPRLSWKRLKKLYDVKRFLDKREVLEELDRGDMSPPLRAYVMKLAFHENIAMDKVMQFWKAPHEFLEIDDAHTSEAINASKKPSNYLSLPFLGMRAEDLRDALVEGGLDHLQTLQPMTQEYRVRGGSVMTPEMLAAERTQRLEPAALHAALVSAIGMQKQGIPGKARNPKWVFGRVQGFLKECGVAWAAVWDASTGSETLSGMSDEQRKHLAEIIDDEEFGIPTAVRGDEYRMILGKKSDPDMVIAGNDTASCMPFGSGKNNVYMYNPNCVQLVLQRKTSGGTWRTAAQSVVSIDVETGKPTPELIAAYAQQGKLKELISLDALTHPGVVTCDNIEVAKNAEGNRSQDIARVYEQFWRTYLAEHASQLRVDTTRVIVGTGYTPDVLGLALVKNTFVPLAPMGYSDNVHAQAFEIRTGLPDIEPQFITGIAPMTTRDVLAVALLEGKAYHDNVSLLENLHGMQNNVIGMEIANTHLHRPNFSFVFRDGKSKPRGYMLAYEGMNGKKPEVYIADLAADPESKLAGGRLITAFFDAYLAAYGQDNRPYLPIFTNARDQTSYRIIQSQFQRMLQRAGLVGELIELGSHHHGPDIIHDVRMCIAKTPEELERQKREYARVGASSYDDDEIDMGSSRSWDDL